MTPSGRGRFRPALRRLAVCVVLLALTGSLSSCNRGHSAPTALTIWTHGGTAEERAALEASVRAFEAATPSVRVTITQVKEGDYTTQLQAAVAAHTVPDVIDVDGPLIAGFASEHALAPLDHLLAPSTIAAMLPSLKTQGTWQGQLWALGTFDSGLALFANRRLLSAAGVTWPTSVDHSWTAAEFSSALQKLAAHDSDHRVIDLKSNYGVGEWLTYGFSPLLYSAGGGLVDPSTGKATGVMNSAASVRAMTWLQKWSRYADPNADDKAFVDGRVALSWVGHWAYADYVKARGNDLLVLPLPDLGLGVKTGQGSWAWAVSATSTHKPQAAALIDFFARKDQTLAMTAANGAVPGSNDALAASTLERSGGPLELYAQQLQRSCGSGPVTRDCLSVPRPVTPTYAALTAAFAGAVGRILSGADPQKALTTAAARYDSERG